MNISQELKTQFKNGNATFKIGFISILSMLIIAILNLIFKQNIENYLALFAKKTYFWTFLTFPLVHFDGIKLLLDLLFLFFMERMFRNFFNEKNFWVFFIFGTLLSGIVFFLASLFLPISGNLSGFSAGTFACLFAIVRYQPKMEMNLLFLPIKFNLLIFALIILILFTVIPMLMLKGSGIYTSQFFGALFGYFYMGEFEKGNDFLGNLFNFNFKNIFNFKKSPKSKIPPRDDYDFNSQKVDTQRQIDIILEKIAKSGYDSLSKSEKDFLFNNR